MEIATESHDSRGDAAVYENPRTSEVTESPPYFYLEEEHQHQQQLSVSTQLPSNTARPPQHPLQHDEVQKHPQHQGQHQHPSTPAPLRSRQPEQAESGSDEQSSEKYQLHRPPEPCLKICQEQHTVSQQQQQRRLISIARRAQAPTTPPSFLEGSPETENNAAVTPEEVLTLGLLALAGLWSGTWCGIAAIIIQQVERLAQRGAADVPFRRCAQALVDMLLRSPGEANLAIETWQHLAVAQAHLPEDLAQVLSLACSLLQRRTMDAAGVKARKRRRRAYSADAVAALSAPPLQLAPSGATALVFLVCDIGREEEQEEKKEKKRRKGTLRMASSPPPLHHAPQPLPPSLPLPLPSTSTSTLSPSLSPQLPPLASFPSEQPSLQQPPQQQQQPFLQHASPALHLPLQQVSSQTENILPLSPETMPAFAPMPMVVVSDDLHSGDGWESTVGGYAGGGDFSLSIPHTSPQRAMTDWTLNSVYQASQVPYSLPLSIQPAPLSNGASYTLQSAQGEGAIDDEEAAVQLVSPSIADMGESSNSIS